MLNDLKVMLGVAQDDTSLDAKLELIISTATARLKTLLGGLEPPVEMAHIIREVAIVRYNRIGSEGMASHTVEGESLSFSSNDFAEYMDEIQAFLDTQKESTRGRLIFL